MNRAHLETLLICSVRYALGRSTYIVDDVCQIVRAHIPELTINAITVIMRDILIEINRKYKGHTCDFESWTKLSNDLENYYIKHHRKEDESV